MGAGVAASPHCPCAVDTRPGRRGCPRGAVSRTESSRGLEAGPPGSVMSREARSGFPAGSPSRPKPWRFAVRQFRNPCEFRLLPSRSAGRSPVPLRQDPSAEASGLPDGPRTEVPVPPFRSSRAAKPGPARRPKGRSPPSAGGGARAFASLSAGRVFRTEVFRPRLLRSWRTRRSTGTRALDDACRFRIRSRASPQHPHGGGFVSRPASASWTSSPGGTKRPASLGLWPEGSPPFPVDRLGHESEAVTKRESGQADSACG